MVKIIVYVEYLNYETYYRCLENYEKYYLFIFYFKSY